MSSTAIKLTILPKAEGEFVAEPEEEIGQGNGGWAMPHYEKKKQAEVVEPEIIEAPKHDIAAKIAKVLPLQSGQLAAQLVEQRLVNNEIDALEALIAKDLLTKQAKEAEEEHQLWLAIDAARIESDLRLQEEELMVALLLMTA